MIEAQLDALGVETRRTIYRMLLEHPRSVSEIAAGLPVSRPAVSQHLKVLLDADLVRVSNVGTRRVYAADPAGVAALREWADEMWSMAMGSFERFARRAAEEEMHMQNIEPVVKTIAVPGDPEWAFQLFTTRIDEWWPKQSHSVGGDDAQRVAVEPGEHGRVFEVTSDGVEHEWGRITVWEPAGRLAFTWHPGTAEEQATHVEITFRADAEGTEVTIVHDGWAARGADAGKIRDGYDTGWDFVLGRVPGAMPITAGS